MHLLSAICSVADCLLPIHKAIDAILDVVNRIDPMLWTARCFTSGGCRCQMKMETIFCTSTPPTLI